MTCKIFNDLVRSSLAAAGACILLLAAPAARAAEPAAVVKTYADIAQAAYEDTLTAGKALQQAIAGFLAKPSPETQKAAREAWLAARVPYHADGSLPLRQPDRRRLGRQGEFLAAR